ncbi:hypothetical protein LEP1GSC109_4861 [Leptospira interrogans str. UI 13372]|nr:hypothetical protein LEP1GSC098_2264 [Leptospira interrogans serovar Grippotyphosa str. UI 08434]EMO94444.1 hypothetical protein LEP1GSC109_4861 [Leptospira interrogans str. UI 13372]
MTSSLRVIFKYFYGHLYKMKFSFKNRQTVILCKNSILKLLSLNL